MIKRWVFRRLFLWSALYVHMLRARRSKTASVAAMSASIHLARRHQARPAIPVLPDHLREISWDQARADQRALTALRHNFKKNSGLTGNNNLAYASKGRHQACRDPHEHRWQIATIKPIYGRPVVNS
jgi:hypothetical protein